MEERLAKIKEKIKDNNDTLTQILPYAEASKLILEKKTEKNDEILINIFHPVLFKRQEHKHLYLIPVRNFRQSCERIFSWNLNYELDNMSEKEKTQLLEKRENSANVYLEILTNFDEVKITRIPCHKLTNSTRELKDTLQKWEDYDPTGNFGEKKTIEYLLRIYCLRLYETLEESILSEEEISEERFFGNKKKIILFKNSNLMQVSILRNGVETQDPGREHYSLSVSISEINFSRKKF